MDRSGYNNLTIKAYTTGTTQAADPLKELPRAGEIGFDTVYPGGLFGAASFHIPRDVTGYQDIRGGYRVVIRNGAKPVFEGYVTLDDAIINQDAQGTTINLGGGWAWIVSRWGINKVWMDDRIDENVWMEQITSTTKNELFDVQRIDGNLHISPKGGSTFADGNYAAVRYTMPVDQTVKRITYDCGLAEATGAWEISAWRSTDASTWAVLKEAAPSLDVFAGVPVTSVITSATTETHDITLNVASRYVELRFYARGANTPVGEDHNHGYWDNLKVYSETDASITPAVVVGDVLAYCTELNTGTTLLAANTLALGSFLTGGWQTLDQILLNVAALGDAQYDAWAVGLRESEMAPTPNGAPVLYYEEQPALTDYEYAMRLDELPEGTIITRDYTGIINYVPVEYTDPNGTPQYLTPTDNAALNDTASVAAYGRKLPDGGGLRLGSATSAEALSLGATLVARYAEPQYNLTAPIRAAGYVRGKNGQRVPACEVRAGQRIRIGNFLQDLSGTGLTLLITGTHYDDVTETVEIYTGRPDSYAVMMARMQAGLFTMGTTGPGRGGR